MIKIVATNEQCMFSDCPNKGYIKIIVSEAETLTLCEDCFKEYKERLAKNLP